MINEPSQRRPPGDYTIRGSGGIRSKVWEVWLDGHLIGTATAENARLSLLGKVHPEDTLTLEPDTVEHE